MLVLELETNLLVLNVIELEFELSSGLFHHIFELVSSDLALEATELVSEPVTQMAVEMINNHLISVQQKR